jgi:hypothetical protein
MRRFYPELTLGANELSDGRRREVGEFLVDVVRERGFPLHVANLWNALYFGWDLAERRYVAATIEPSRIPKRIMNMRGAPLPVGAFVRVETKTAAGDLWAEVVYKEGADPRLDASDLPAELCGKPSDVAEVDGRRAVVARERFVLDIGAFGNEQNRITPTAYDRLLRRARWVDERGHLVLETVYSPDDAALGDVDQYVNYLLDSHDDGLLAFCFSEEPTKADLREALVRSFAAVRDIALGRPELGSWREKLFFDKERYREQTSDQDPLPLCAADLSYLFRSLARLPKEQDVGYASLGPRLDELFSNDGYDEEEKGLMRGPAYVQAITYANAFMRDQLRTEAPDGLLGDGLNLRLDDDWQGGGVWRCERLDSPTSIALLPPDLPLHLGLAEAGPIPMKESPVDSEPEVVTVQGFMVALTRRDIASGRLRMPRRVVEALASPGAVTLRLRHEGETVEQTAELDRGADAIMGIPWPPSLYPGVRIHGNVERGGTVVKVRTQDLIDPVTIEGVQLRYEFVKSVYERETGEPGLPAEERRATTTLNDLIFQAFRRYGRDLENDGKALSRRQIERAVLGPNARASESQALANAVAQLDLEREGAAYIWRPRVTRRTSVSDRSVLAAYCESPSHRLGQIVRRHYVPMHLRHMIQRGVSDEKIDSYADARTKYGMQGLLPATLPEGYTWVEPYEWGADADDVVSAATPS